MSVIRFALCLILLFTVAIAPAQAAPKNFHVGAGCTYATIQAALEAERMNPGSPVDFIWVVRNQPYDAQDIQIHDQNVFLYGGIGGSINFAGTGKLTIGSSTITNNHAEYGGGINFRGTGSANDIAELWINFETQITNNTATTSGGG